jgi:hypothetical protein
MQNEELENKALEGARAFNKMHAVYELMYNEITRLNFEIIQMKNVAVKRIKP